MNMTFIRCFFVLLLAGCAAGPAQVGERIETGVGQSKVLLVRVDGWEVWETRYGPVKTCLAMKPADGGGWPMIFPGSSIVIGPTPGFYMTASAKYGVSGNFWTLSRENVYWMAEIDGDTFSSFSNINDALAKRLDGKVGRFDITSYRYRYVPSAGWKAGGTINFTGFKAAYDAVSSCSFKA